MHVYFHGDKKNADMMDNIKNLFKFETTTKLLCFHKKTFML